MPGIGCATRVSKKLVFCLSYLSRMPRISEQIVWIAGSFFGLAAYLAYSSQIFLMPQPPRAAFQASRLTSSTFLIKEYNDIFSEHPHIYAKVVPIKNTILIIDTGCGGSSNDTTIELKSLKEFIETVNIEDNDGLPLNQDGKMGYVVALTHCHYDHIRAYQTALIVDLHLDIRCAFIVGVEDL